MHTGGVWQEGERMNREYIAFAIIISAAITFMWRALPFVLFSGERRMPAVLDRLGRMLPPAVMAILIVYCVKDIDGSFMDTGIWQLISVAVVAVSYKLKKSTFLSILLGTACYMVLLRLPF